ncbi:type II CRISPR RNA-guided endonuclease Cas9 [Flavihumibacter sp. UBA7668]|uniref:type II CRISPR RNA-guided endonuclease Cas9 n=1 Tax=Flavihumibacter sp. UBA7668 TaxID=1946542 RepID=UPI0025C0D2E1|nr:type II CRISPR RNA-guided endonuclease Cas9 [Flavihumibacter sp. UBA7668]
MSKILGLDLGTNSIGWSIRNTQLSGNQIEKVGVITFNKGVGNSKTGEYSYAAERTKKKSARRLYQARKYRIWATLEVLINEGFCPLSIESLNKWRHYDKNEASRNSNSGRIYPVNDIAFEQWVKLDFDGDGVNDYKSPYQLRRELVTDIHDFGQAVNRYKLGRALYHIAQRRGFKSSRKGSDDVKENNESADVDLQYSEKKKNKTILELQERYPSATTIGALFAYLEDDGVRIREDMMQFVIRENYKEEIYKIFQFQGISEDSNLFKSLVESAPNRNDGKIFYKRPLRSQKGLVGFCTLEQETRIDPKSQKPIQVGKFRVPISHPSFELFRAWQFMNSIKYFDETSGIKRPLDLELKKEIISEKFFRKSKAYFSFFEIEEFIQKKGYQWKLNYKSKHTVTACPVSARLKDIFGQNFLETRIPKVASPNKKKDYYDIYDIWHVLFSFDDQEFVFDFALNKLKLNKEQAKQFVYAWNAMPVGYGMLSLNAVNKINKFLFKGLIYSEAVLLANIPSIVGVDKWEKNEEYILEHIDDLVSENRFQKNIVMIVNNLISKYKNLDQKFGYKNEDYQLDERDLQEVSEAVLESIGSKNWNVLSRPEQDITLNSVKDCYQYFFRSKGLNRQDINGERYLVVETNGRKFYKSDAGYYRQPKLKDELANFASKQLNVPADKLRKIYHPSDISVYPPAMPDENGVIKMGSPKTGSFKNPMAMRTLHELRKLLNFLIKTGQIDSETRVVVEVARQLNDSNKRWAIETWQRHREAENAEFAGAIEELIKQENVSADNRSDTDIDKMRLWYEQNKEESVPEMSESKKEVKGIRWSENRRKSYKEIIGKKLMIEKYRLWKEQKCICIYTSRAIGISDLFNSNVVDVEHTIPRSLSFDDSLANKTVAYMDFNRTEKKNLIPSKLHPDIYQMVLNNIKPWEEKVERIVQQIDFWKMKAKKAADKEWKDDAIKQKHLWQMEFDYWNNKIARFRMEMVPSGFKNSQLVDTQLISKYAFHYLKTYFEKVDVQKGETTSKFRKIFQIQPKDELKDRSKHSHHAEDATVLTLIPQAGKRDEILKGYYESLENRLKFEPIKPYPSFNPQAIRDIDKTLLVNSLNNIQFLSNAKRVVRKRGKVQYLPGSDSVMIATGDCIRGQLHQETFYGAIKPAKIDGEGKMVRDSEGNIVQEDKLKFTLRVPFLYKSKPEGSGFKTWEEIEKLVVDEGLKKQIKQQIDKAGGLKEAFELGFYMLDANGEKIGKNRIRHVRTWANISEPLQVKKHTYLSSKDYKQFYYAANA